MIKAGFHWRLRSPKWSRKSPYDSVKIKNRSCKLSQKNKNVSISLRLHCLRPSENQIDGVKSGTLDKPTTMHDFFVIGLVLPLLLATPTT